MDPGGGRCMGGMVIQQPTYIGHTHIQVKSQLDPKKIVMFHGY